jgi:hypothetical protein
LAVGWVGIKSYSIYRLLKLQAERRG